jgi:hypothetical protein
MADGDLLTVRDLHAFYGESHVLHGASLSIRQGEIVTDAVRSATPGARLSPCPRTGSRGSASPYAPRSAGFSPPSMSRKT